MISLKKNIGLIGFLIICVTVTPAFAIDDRNRNMFLIYVMYLAPLLFVCFKSRDIKVELTLISLGALMFFVPAMSHPKSFRISTIIFSYLYFMYFMTYTRVLGNKAYNREIFINLLKYLIYAYTITLIIQQFCVLTGLPIFNKAAYNPIEPWKLNALAPEPSHTARIMSLILFIYVNMVCKPYNNLKFKSTLKLLDKCVVFCYLYCIVTMGSGTGFLCLALIILQFLPKGNKLFYVVMALLCFVGAYFMFRNIPSFQRTFNFIISLINYNEEALISEDLSAAIRIVPTIHGFKAIDFLSWDSFWGHGIDADEGLTPLPSVDCGAGSFSIWYNYGFIISLIFWVFSLKICLVKNEKVASIVIWVFLVLFYGGINNPIIWMTLILMYTYKKTNYVTYK